MEDEPKEPAPSGLKESSTRLLVSLLRKDAYDIVMQIRRSVDSRESGVAELERALDLANQCLLMACSFEDALSQELKARELKNKEPEND